MKRKEVSLSYLAAIMEVYEKTQTPSKITLNTIFRKHKVTNSIGTELIKKGMLTKVSPKTYKWVGKRPSLLMVEDIRSKRAELAIQYNRKKGSATPKTNKSVRVYKSRKPQSIETKFFFGLFTLKSKINY